MKSNRPFKRLKQLNEEFKLIENNWKMRPFINYNRQYCGKRRLIDLQSQTKCLHILSF